MKKTRLHSVAALAAVAVLTAAFASVSEAATVRMDGNVLDYEITDNVAWITNVTRSGPSGAEPVVCIPATIENKNVGLRASAFGAFAGEREWYLDFLGDPPELDGELPGTACCCCYPRSRSTAWVSACSIQTVEDGAYYLWKGLYAFESPFVRSWDDLKTAVDDTSVDYVQLACPIVQPADEVALTITNRTFDIQLNGFGIVASNRVAEIQAGGVLELMGAGGGTGNTLSGTHSVSGQPGADSGGLIRVGQGAVLAAWDVTFTNAQNGLVLEYAQMWDKLHCGGAVAVEGGSASFSGCRFVDCRAGRDGGALYMRGGTLDLSDCTFSGNWAPYGSAVNADGTNWISRCEFRRNAAGPRGTVCIHDNGLCIMEDAVIAENTVQDDFGGPVFLAPNASCVFTNVLVVGNTYPNGGTRASATVVTFGDDSKVSFASGVLDAQPAYSRECGAKSQKPLDVWAAEGFERCPVGAVWTVARAGTVATNEQGRIWKGVFLFDPSAERYKSYLPLDPAASVTACNTRPETFEVQVQNGGPYKTVVEGVTYTFLVRSGDAVLTSDYGTPAVSPATNDVVVIPAKLEGLEVNGIAARALFDLSGKCFLFMGPPPKSIPGDALPAEGTIRYQQVNAEYWESYPVGAHWGGLPVVAARSYDWEGVRTVLERGESVTLGRDIVAEGRGAVISNAAKRAKLDLYGYSLSVPSETTVWVAITNGASFVLADDGYDPGATSGGTVSGMGETRAGTDPVIDVQDGSFTLSGGVLQSFKGVRPLVRVGPRALFAMQGGAICDCDAQAGGPSETGAIVAVDGGMCEVRGGAISRNRSLDAALVSVRNGGAAVFYGGMLTANELGAGLHLFEVDGTARLLFLGPLVQGNTCGGSPLPADTADLTRLVIQGGIFDVRPDDACLEWGYEIVALAVDATIWPSGVAYLVAEKDTVAVADGKLTAGTFTFNPEKVLLEALGLVDDENNEISAVVGTTETWALSKRGFVECKTVSELRANALAGNETRFVPSVSQDEPCKMPSGFVYRAAVRDEKNVAVTNGSLLVTLRLYDVETGGTALWTGATNVFPKSEGVFQVWVDDTLRTEGTTALADFFADGRGLYLGATFENGDECQPRRNLVSVPLVSRARRAGEFAPSASVARLQVSTGTVTCAGLTLADGGICNTLEIQGTNGVLSVTSMDVGGVTLYRHADNRILASRDGDWVAVDVKTGDALVRLVSESCLLTLQSTDGDTVPMLVVPIPAGGSFVWQSTPFKGRYRLTYLGESN